LCAVARRSARAAFPPGLCSGSEPGRVRLEPPAPERRHQEATQTERAAQGPCRERSRSNQEQSMPSPFVLSCRQCRVYYGLGSNRAEAYQRRNEQLLLRAKTWQNVQMYFSKWEGDTEEGRARIHGARGRYSEAEAAWRRARALYRDTMEKSKTWPITTFRS